MQRCSGAETNLGFAQLVMAETFNFLQLIRWDLAYREDREEFR